MKYLFFSQGDYVAAASQLRLCLAALGRPLPTSKLDLASSLSWNYLRHGLNRLYIGRFFASLAGGLIRKKSSDKFTDAQKSAREGALVYHKLHQLQMAGKKILFHKLHQTKKM